MADETADTRGSDVDEGFLKASQLQEWAEGPAEKLVEEFDSREAADLVVRGFRGFVGAATKVVEGLALEYAPDGVKGIADQILDVDS